MHSQTSQVSSFSSPCRTPIQSRWISTSLLGKGAVTAACKIVFAPFPAAPLSGSGSPNPTPSFHVMARVQPPKEDAGEAGSIEPDSAIAQPPQLGVPTPDEAPPGHESTDQSEKMQKLNKYLAEHTFSDLKEAFAWIALQDKVEAAAVTDVPSVMDAPPAEVEPSSQPPLLEPEDQPLQALGQESKVPQLSQSHHSWSESPPQGEKSVNEAPKKKISVEEIVQNGKKWMSEEVMLAFQKYIEKRDDFEGLEYSLEELRYQCFSVESYRKTFHHYNFVVKMNKPSSADSTLILYFAEVKEMFGNKLYFCCPLESDDDGHCYACKNQGMDELKHPDEGGYQRGLPDSGGPFVCLCMEHDEEDMPMPTGWRFEGSLFD